MNYHTKILIKKIYKVIIFIFSKIQLLEVQLIKQFSKKTDGIIVIRTDNIGDFIIFLPTFRYYRKIYPGKRITLVINESCKELIERLNQENIFDDYIYFYAKKYKLNIFYRIKFTFQLTRYSYAVAINPLYSRTGTIDQIMRMVISDKKIGFSSKNSNLKNNAMKRFDSTYTTLFTTPSNIEKETDRNQAFANFLGVRIDTDCLPNLICNQQDYKKAEDLIKKYCIPEKFCVLFPGAADYYRVWPEYKYSEVVKFLLGKGITPVICGSIKELPIANKVSPITSECIILNGKTNIWLLAALLKKSKFYLGSETGIMHLAAAVKTPIICLIGGGHFGRFFPYGDLNANRVVYDHNMKCKNDDWACAKDMDKPAPCIEGIQVKDVISEISSLLSFIETKNNEA